MGRRFCSSGGERIVAYTGVELASNAVYGGGAAPIAGRGEIRGPHSRGTCGTPSPPLARDLPLNLARVARAARCVAAPGCPALPAGLHASGTCSTQLPRAAPQAHHAARPRPRRRWHVRHAVSQHLSARNYKTTGDAVKAFARMVHRSVPAHMACPLACARRTGRLHAAGSHHRWIVVLDCSRTHSHPCPCFGLDLPHAF
jgi:hypothetical protein